MIKFKNEWRLLYMKELLVAIIFNIFYLLQFNKHCLKFREKYSMLQYSSTITICSLKQMEIHK